MAITLEEARKALGKTGKKMTDEEVQSTMTLLDSLAETFLDKYERMLYKGITVKELSNGDIPHLDHDQQKSQAKFEEYFKEWQAKHR